MNVGLEWQAPGPVDQNALELEVEYDSEVGKAFHRANVGDLRPPGSVRHRNIDPPSQRFAGGHRRLEPITKFGLPQSRQLNRATWVV